MNALIFSIFNGALYGLLLFMLSSGLTLIFSMMGVLNLAHSSLFMLGAYFAYTISKYAGFWPALIFAPLIVGVIGAMIERFGLRRVHKFGHVAELLFTFGLFFVFEELVQMVWGKVPVPYEIPDSLDFALFTWLGLEYSAYRVFMVLCSLGIMVALYWLIARTRVGRPGRNSRGAWGQCTGDRTRHGGPARSYHFCRYCVGRPGVSGRGGRCLVGHRHPDQYGDFLRYFIQTLFCRAGGQPRVRGGWSGLNCHDQWIYCPDPALPYAGFDADFPAARIIWNP
jgi:hypothetical protein